MAITGRDARKIDFDSSRMDKGLGPGTYNPKDMSDWKVKHGRAPFGSTTGRMTHIDKDMNTPGPGAYAELKIGPNPIGGGGSRVKASATFASRTMRMANDTHLPKEAMMPGPGAYNQPIPWIKKSMSIGPSQTTPNRSINWVKVSTAPSIPAPNQSYGYEEGPKGELIQQKAPEVGFTGKNTTETAGPGYYEPHMDITKANTSKAPSFGASKRKNLREGVQVSKELVSHPGPGSYELQSSGIGSNLKPPTNDDDNPIRPSPVFLSSTKRDKLGFQAAVETPGPGAYMAPSQFKTAAEITANVADQVQAFGTTTRKQFQTAQEQHPVTVRNPSVPGPGAYDDQALIGFERKAKEKEQAQNQVKQAAHGAFSSTVHRFHDPKTTNKQTPGPGYYGAEGGLAQGLGRKTVGRYGIFGTTSQRFPAPPRISQPTAEGGLGPGSYDPKPIAAPAETRRKDGRSSTFSSKTPRKAISTDAPMDVPPVGTYTRDDNYWIKKSCNIKTSSISKAPRFAAPEKKENWPGPGHYSAGGTKGKVLVHGEIKKTNFAGLDRQGQHKAHGPLAPRFKIDIEKDRMPGPGSYETGSAMVKKTFNITIGETWA